MRALLTAAEMRAVERAAMDSGAVTGLALMERAGQGVVAAIAEAWPELAARRGRAVVLCGPGNNGGDGYVVARLLQARGWRVELFAMGEPARMSADARANRERWSTLGPIGALEAAGQGARPALLVDALFGTGLSRAIPAGAADAHAAVRARPGAGRCRVVAVDAPSGLDCDSGRLRLPDGGDDAAPARWRLPADLTVTFHAAKPGHYLDAGPGLCGRLVVHDIGIVEGDAPVSRAEGRPRARLVGPASGAEGTTAEGADGGSDGGADGGADGGPRWPAGLLPALGPAGHKYQRGHALVLAGGPGRGGAARMAARAALRVGAGLVTLACPTSARAENAARLDAVMLREVDAPGDLDRLLADGRLSSVCLGPGLGVGAQTRALVAAACRGGASGGRRAVLDADALTSFADDPAALFALLHPLCVLTPHEGEFARVFPDLGLRARAAADLSKLDAARAAAARAGCTVLLKGADTVIASPGGAASVHAAAYDRAAPWLATAGAGDVLAGLIAGLLAPPDSADSPHPAVEAAAWLHVEAARRAGPGLIAEDLPEALPGVFRALGL